MRETAMFHNNHLIYNKLIQRESVKDIGRKSYIESVKHRMQRHNRNIIHRKGTSGASENTESDTLLLSGEEALPPVI